MMGAVVGKPDAEVLDVRGSGAVTCIQGLLTNDLEGPGEGAFVYGAVLTPKGMIVTDVWTARIGSSVTLFVPTQGKEPLLDIFRRTLPPRLARVSERPERTDVVWLAGPSALDVAAAAGIEPPTPGRVTVGLKGHASRLVARPLEGAPFGLALALHGEAAVSMRARLEDAGAVSGTSGTLETGRILAGWPRLGAEIDRKTLPQEVRFDQINGVSYTKGCYTGQETVARVHFRGHPNRLLTGLTWENAPDLGRTDVRQGDRQVGRVTSIAWLAPNEEYIGLSMIRREVDRSKAVWAAGVEAKVIELPFTFDN